MKVLLPLLTLFALAHVTSAADMTSLRGETFINATITRAEPDGLVVMHSAGVAKIPFTDLGPEIQAKYHYDPKAAAAFADEVAAKQVAIYQNAQRAKEQTAEAAAAATRKTEREKVESAGAMPHNNDKFNIETVEGPIGIVAKYTSKEGLAAEEVRSGKNLMLADAQIDKNVASLPVGGRLEFQISRPTIESANTKWFTIIVCDRKGNELFRQSGKNSIPQSATIGSG